jgi:predicted molibdopterin-dependent oxidoreductase YjgC
LRHRPGTEATLLAGLARTVLDEALEDKEFVTERCTDLERLKQELWAFDPEKVSRECGVSTEQIEAAARAFAGAGPAAILYGANAGSDECQSDMVGAVLNLALLTGNVGKPGGGVFPLFTGANSQGVADMGCAATLLPGHRRVSSEEERNEVCTLWNEAVPAGEGIDGLNAWSAMNDDRIKAAVVQTDGLLADVDNEEEVVQSLARTEFLVVSAVFESELTETADVVLPAATYAEETGTVTNLERRVQLVRPCRGRRHEETPGWETLSLLARKMGADGFDHDGPARVFDEIRSAVPAYAGLTYDRLSEGGIQWPCPEEGHPGTPVLQADVNAGIRSGFVSIAPRISPSIARDDYPFVLAPGRVLHQPGREVKVENVDGLNRIRREELVEVHPEDAERLGIDEGDYVEITGPSLDQAFTGTATLTSPQPGLVCVTTLFGPVACRMQTSDNPDPVTEIDTLDLRPVNVAKVPARSTADAVGD